ncbi:MAG: hypothetical protein LDL39_06035 [Magnetospirillum sp.]|nr:hypothetical protein [Magnetospirillum sp.]
MTNLPEIALSVRQPWAWAIVTGGKDIENRSTFAVTKGGFDARSIAIHAAKGMTRDEYEDAAQFMAELGVTCPLPRDLVRGAIIGAATVKAVVTDHDSPWFFGPRGLVLADQRQCDPIPAVGALGYFPWSASGALAPPLPWMLAWPENARRREPEFQRPTPPAMPRLL